MKKGLLLPVVLLALNSVSAQDKIKDGTNSSSSTSPEARALLELESSWRGLLLPRFSLTTTTTWPANSSNSTDGPATAGYFAYNTNSDVTGTTNYPIITGGVGVYYWDGSGWVATKAPAANEPWYDQATLKQATSNTQNIYQSGNVAVQKAGVYVQAKNNSNQQDSVTLDVNGAFRAGLFDVSGVYIGKYSTALGYRTSALNLYDVALGNQTVANGGAAFAAGYKSVANGNNSIALGNADSATGTNSTAFGLSNIASGNQSFVLGYLNKATNTSTFAGGTYSIATNGNAFSYGASDTAGGANSAVLGGSQNMVSGAYSAVLGGSQNKVSGSNSVSLGGSYNTASGSSAFVGGYQAVATGLYSFAYGNNAYAFQNHALAFGVGSIAPYRSAVALGRFNSYIDSTGGGATGLTGFPIFQVGQGSDFTTRSNLITGYYGMVTDGSYGKGWVVIGDDVPSTASGYGSTTANRIGSAILSVKGSIAASGSINVGGSITGNVTTFPDYVFDNYFDGKSAIDPKYKFTSLSETEKFIKANHHLPGVTPVSQLEKSNNGYAIDLGKTATQTLEKTEELYLHVIEQQKTIDTQEKTISELQKTLQALNDRLNKLEHK